MMRKKCYFSLGRVALCFWHDLGAINIWHRQYTQMRNDPYTHFSQQSHNKLTWLVIEYPYCNFWKYEINIVYITSKWSFPEKLCLAYYCLNFFYEEIKLKTCHDNIQIRVGSTCLKHSKGGVERKVSSPMTPCRRTISTHQRASLVTSPMERDKAAQKPLNSLKKIRSPIIQQKLVRPIG